jgi:hypothetical protein
LFALCWDAIVDVPLLVLLSVLLLVVLSVGEPPEAPPIPLRSAEIDCRSCCNELKRSVGPFAPEAAVEAVLLVAVVLDASVEPPEAAPIPLRSAEIDCKSCCNELKRSLMPLVPEAAVEGVLPVAIVVDAAVLLVEAPPPSRPETRDCRPSIRLDMPPPKPPSPSVAPGGEKEGSPLGEPTPTEPVPWEVPLVASALSPNMPPNDRNWDMRPLDSVGSVLPVSALPDAPAAAESAENVVAVLSVDPLLCPDGEADCAARCAASCAQSWLCPDIELSIGSLMCDDVRITQEACQPRSSAIAGECRGSAWRSFRVGRVHPAISAGLADAARHGLPHCAAAAPSRSLARGHGGLAAAAETKSAVRNDRSVALG